ncbi:hypothetical protein J8L73_05820 [Pseudoalteromonas sp. MMG006]|uniref:hypothetical protein n=1 Tax=unclassified Pseudoalteromonas TaxID=194690 RepID=UPI001B38A472|nr:MULTISPECIES: hypothetical protein [unclassified Pseudoalteromonas]MBQ4798646.1 hypothetical protein [Pseudoalteromonas sp. MMG006]MBQ4859170.1 hypothetical protein [Pseudoalteromonas sp. MMG007]
MDADRNPASRMNYLQQSLFEEDRPLAVIANVIFVNYFKSFAFRASKLSAYRCLGELCLLIEVMS